MHLRIGRSIQIPVAAAALVLLVMLPAQVARAQTADSAAAADKLFTEGRELMAEGKLEAACEKLEASLALDPAIGTALNLALCFEQRGMLASAWARYREAEDRAARERDNRARAARERAAALEPRLPRLVIEVTEAAPGLAVTRNRAAVSASLLGTAVPVDPGEHEIEARAPGHARFATTVTAVEGEAIAVTIPPLEPLPPGAEPDDAAGGKPGFMAPGLPGEAGAVDSSARGKTRQRIGLITGGAGVAAVGVGLGFGWSAIQSWNEPFDDGLCVRETRQCSPEGQVLTDRARTRATVANVITGAGVALVATGVVLYLTAPRGEATERQARRVVATERQARRVVPLAGRDGVGLAVLGAF